MLKFHINKKKLKNWWGFNCCLTDICKEVCEDIHIKAWDVAAHSLTERHRGPVSPFLFSQICVSPGTCFLSVCFPDCWPLALCWFFIAPSYIFSKNKTSVTEVTLWLFTQRDAGEMLTSTENMYHGKVKIAVRNLTLEFPAWWVFKVNVFIWWACLALNEKLEPR